MQTVKIPLMGITHATSDNMSNDGEMSELLNLRHKDGSLQPTYEAKKIISLDVDYDKLFIHSNANYENWIAYRSDTGQIVWVASKTEEVTLKETPLVLLTTQGFTSIEQVGNILTIIEDTGIRYLYFRDGVYNLIDLDRAFRNIRFRPQLRSANENPVQVIGTITPINYGSMVVTCPYADYADYLVSLMGDTNEIDSDLPQNVRGKKSLDTALLGAINKTKAVADENGWLHGARYIRYAVRLYDGSHILHSAPILIIPPRGIDKEEIVTQYATDGETLKRIYLLSVYKLIMEWDAVDLSSLNGIVSAIDVFMSQSIDKVDYNDPYVYLHNAEVGAPMEYETVNIIKRDVTNSTGTTTTKYPDTPLWRFKENEDFMDNLKSESLFYKVMELSIDQLSTQGDTFLDTANTRDILVTKERLSDDEYTHNKYTASASFVYNSKLHIGNIKSHLYHGYPVEYMIPREVISNNPEAGTVSVCIETTIETSEGKRLVYSPVVEVNDTLNVMRSMISYPDYRARKMRILFKRNGVWDRCREITLEPHKTLNQSFYLNERLTGIPLFSSYRTQPLNTVFEIPTAGAIEVQPKIIKASVVSNPFVFKAANTYDIGGDVVAIASVNQSVSEGTAFGETPLYVFTSEGIKLLHVGSGDVYYSRVSEASRDVCINKDGVLPINVGIIFPTSRGLASISGTTVRYISDAMRGVWADNIMAEDRVIEATTNQTWANVSDLLTVFPFEHFYNTFLENASIGYNRMEDELIISGQSPSGLTLCFVVNTNSWLWHKASYITKQFITTPSTLLYLSSDGVYDMNKTGKPLGAVMITRPIKAGSTAFKSVRRAIMRGSFYAGQLTESGALVYSYEDLYNGNNYTRLMLYGSQDCYRWKYLGGVDRGGSFNDLSLNSFHTSCKYFRVVYIGTPFYSTRFDSIEIHIGEKYNSKPR